MKKGRYFILVIMMCFSCIACSSQSDDSKTNVSKKDIVPQDSQMKTICELATMNCYYHTVAKYSQEDASGILWWKKDRHFWVEYAGIVTIGIDASLVHIEVNEENVTITIPPAKVLGCKVDEKTLTEDSFIVSKNSAKVEADHQTEAFKQAQAKMQEKASSDTTLLATAQQRAQKLLENYVKNIGEQTKKNYSIQWNYVEGAEELHNVKTEPMPTQEETKT